MMEEKGATTRWSRARSGGVTPRRRARTVKQMRSGGAT
jgi:hypothetical protein